LSLDPPAHAPFRILLSGGLSPQRVSKVEATIRDLTVGLIEQLKPRGQCDFTTEFAELLPIKIFMQIVDISEHDTPKLKHFADQFTRPDGSLTYPQVVEHFHDSLAPLLAARRGSDGDDMLSRMINGQVDGRPLTDEEATNLCIQVLVGGLDTVVNFLAFVMLFMAENKTARDDLRANPDKLPLAINELARRFPLVTVGRELRHDMEFEGVTLKQGEMIVAPTILHGLGEHETPDPITVDFKRENVQHSTFGAGSHSCPGAHLARTETRLVLEAWLPRIPAFHLPAGQDIRFTGGIVGIVNALPLEWKLN